MHGQFNHLKTNGNKCVYLLVRKEVLQHCHCIAIGRNRMRVRNSFGTVSGPVRDTGPRRQMIPFADDYLSAMAGQSAHYGKTVGIGAISDENAGAS